MSKFLTFSIQNWQLSKICGFQLLHNLYTVGSNLVSHQFFIMLYIQKNNWCQKPKNNLWHYPSFQFFLFKNDFYSRILLEFWEILPRQLKLPLICGFLPVSIPRIQWLFGQKPLHCFNTLEFWFYTLLIQKGINWNQNQKFIHLTKNNNIQ